jgi:ornithine cyclodeaminase
VLILTQSEVRSVLSVACAFEAVARGCTEYSRGEALIPPRTHVAIPEWAADALFMPGYLKGSGVLGMKVVSNFSRNPERGLPVGPGLMILLDHETGVPLVLMDASHLTDLRTGVLSGLAARFLARPDSAIAAIIGSGAQARTQLLALAHVLPLRRALVYSRRPDNVRAFIQEMTGRVPGVEVSAAVTAEEAVRKADVVVAATTSEQPVVHGGWLRPGTLVCGVGSHTPEARELDGEVIARATRAAVDSRAGALKGAGDLGIPLREGVLRAEDVAELGELILGLRPCRSSAEEITVFKSVGFAAADLAVADEIYRQARERRLGREIQLLA